MSHIQSIAAYEHLRARAKEISLIDAASSLLNWDEETHMPRKALPFRAEQVACFSGWSHRQFTAPEVGDWIKACEDHGFAVDSDEAANVREWRRSYDRATRLPAELVEEFNRATTLARDAWADARKRSEFPLFQPHLEKLIALNRQMADKWGYQECRYDALLDGHDFGDLAGPAAMLAGESLLALKRGREAATRFTTAIARGGQSVDTDAALLRLGEAHAAAQDWAQSLRAYERHRSEQAKSPRWYMAEFGIGWAMENSGKPREAIPHYQAVIEKHKGDTAARAQFQFGECLFALGEHEEAVRELLRVDILHASPTWSAAALYEAGRCYEAMGKVGEARAQYRDVQDRFAESDWAKAAGERLAAIAGPGGARTIERGG